MNPTIVGIGVTLATLVVGWFVISGARAIRRSSWRVAERRRIAKRWHEHVEVRQQDAARLESQQIVFEAHREADALIAKAERTAAAIRSEAERIATTIVSDAEQRAREVVAAGEHARARLAQEMTQEQTLMDEKREELSALLRNFLWQVRHVSPGSDQNVVELRDARETRISRASAAE